MQFEEQIDNSHPVVVDTKEAYSFDMLAMELVGERHSKRDLVDLVRWLIMDKAATVRAELFKDPI